MVLSDEPLVRLCWRSKITGASGSGDICRESAGRAWLEYQVSDDAREAWIEPVSPDAIDKPVCDYTAIAIHRFHAQLEVLQMLTRR